MGVSLGLLCLHGLCSARLFSDLPFSFGMGMGVFRKSQSGYLLPGGYHTHCGFGQEWIHQKSVG